DGRATSADLAPSLEAVVSQAREAWLGPPAPPVRVLPSLVKLEDLAPSPDDPGAIPFALSERDRQPVYLRPRHDDPFFVVFGDSGSGKTALLRSLLRGLTARFTPSQAQVILVDYRRTLLDVVPSEFLASYCGAAQVASSQIL